MPDSTDAPVERANKRQTRTPGNAPAAAEASPAVPSDLPNEIDIDATKITQAVLTRQGWVVPAVRG
jgi:hypothetical protein